LEFTRSETAKLLMQYRWEYPLRRVRPREWELPPSHHQHYHHHHSRSSPDYTSTLLRLLLMISPSSRWNCLWERDSFLLLASIFGITPQPDTPSLPILPTYSQMLPTAAGGETVGMVGSNQQPPEVSCYVCGEEAAARHYGSYCCKWVRCNRGILQLIDNDIQWLQGLLPSLRPSAAQLSLSQQRPMSHHQG